MIQARVVTSLVVGSLFSTLPWGGAAGDGAIALPVVEVEIPTPDPQEPRWSWNLNGAASCGGTAPTERSCSNYLPLDRAGAYQIWMDGHYFAVPDYTGAITLHAWTLTYDVQRTCTFVLGAAIACSPTQSYGAPQFGQRLDFRGDANPSATVLGLGVPLGHWSVGACYVDPAPDVGC